MLDVFTLFLFNIIVYNIPLLYGTTGEIMIEKSGSLNLGVEGTMSGSEDMSAQAKSATPTFASQTITPDTGYNCLSQVTVAAIPVAYSDNAQGGQTCTIG